MQYSRSPEIQGHATQYPHMAYMTTSWDDGHKLDLKLAVLLKKYGIKGTFYVCPRDREFWREDLLKPHEILSISEDFEIGGHTITHPHLTRIPLSQADDEIAQSKRYLERLLQREVTAFCYPYGHYNGEVKNLVKKRGYKLARITRRCVFDMPQDRFELPTTFHASRHCLDMLPAVHHLDHHNISFPFHLSPVSITKFLNWERLAIALFEDACQTGGIFHLWGHSWEIEQLNGWQKLENVLAYIATKQHIFHQTNTELLNSFQQKEDL